MVCGDRAAAYLKLGNAEAALKDAEAATELDPDYARAYQRRGCAHQALEHFEDAVRDFEKVCTDLQELFWRVWHVSHFPDFWTAERAVSSLGGCPESGR